MAFAIPDPVRGPCSEEDRDDVSEGVGQIRRVLT